MKHFFRVDTVNGRRVLVPSDRPTEAALERYPVGTIVKADKITKPRNRKHNSLYWVKLQNVVDGSGIAPTAQALHELLKALTGHSQPIRLGRGFSAWRQLLKALGVMEQPNEVFLILPGSTDFERMDEKAFAAFVTDAFDILRRDYGIDPDAIEEAA